MIVFVVALGIMLALDVLVVRRVDVTFVVEAGVVLVSVDFLVVVEAVVVSLAMVVCVVVGVV